MERRMTLPALRPLALALAATLPALAAAAGAPLALLPATGVNVDAGTLAASQEVMRGRLMAQGIDVRVAPGAQNPAAEPTAAEAAASARSVGASRAAALRLVTLGTTLTARLTVHDAATGAVVHNDEVPANGVAELNPALDALAKGYATGKPASAYVAKAPAQAAAAPQQPQAAGKTQAASSGGFRLQGMSPTSSGASDVKLTGVGIYTLYDARALLVELAADGYWADNAHDYTLGFGAYLPIGKGNLAPYGGGGIRYAWSDFGAGSGHGFQPYATAGLVLGRHSSVGVRAELEWWWNTFETGGTTENGVAWKLGVFF
jgi:hypothetical protein